MEFQYNPQQIIVKMLLYQQGQRNNTNNKCCFCLLHNIKISIKTNIRQHLCEKTIKRYLQ